MSNQQEINNQIPQDWSQGFPMDNNNYNNFQQQQVPQQQPVDNNEQQPAKKEKKKLKLQSNTFNVNATEFTPDAPMDFGGFMNQPQQPGFDQFGQQQMFNPQQGFDPNMMMPQDPNMIPQDQNMQGGGFLNQWGFPQMNNFYGGFDQQYNQYGGMDQFGGQFGDFGQQFGMDQFGMFPPMDDFYGQYGGGGGEDYYYDDYYGEEGYVNQRGKGKKEKKKQIQQKVIKTNFKRLDKEKGKTQEEILLENTKNLKKEKHYTPEELIDIETVAIQQGGKEYQRVDCDRQNINIVFIGHVDAGKSTLCGRILKDTGEVKEEDIRKYEQEAKAKHREGWVLAYIMDINEEERAKGKTVECGKASFALEKRRFTLLDAPGHKNYVPNMIMGCSQAEVAGLIVSAKQGEFEAGFEKGGQTQEHALLAKALGVQHVVVIVTKMDQCDWSEKRYNEIYEAIDPFLQKSCGFHSLQYVPIDGFNGQNINELVHESAASWYKGGSLFNTLDLVPIPDRDPCGPIRMPIIDKVRDQGSIYLLGKLESGSIKEDMWVCLLPYRKQFQIVEILDPKDRNLVWAGAGENIKIKVKGLDDDDIDKGYMVCNTDDFAQVTTEFIAKLEILELNEHKKIMSQGYTCVLHIHCAVEEVIISQIEANICPKTKKKIKSSFLKSNSEGIVRIMTPPKVARKYLCIEKFDTNEHLGRFTLRDEEKTIAFGQVLKVKKKI